MKELLINLNKHFENRIRLGIMSVLMVNDWVDFNSMKETLSVTDGNLASHMKALEGERYVEVKKQFIDKKPNTTYRATIDGRKAFEEHLAALEKLINTGR
ncbi:MAG TPA: transcriptional regulator [Tenuifilaceae bacterium]|nr:transcriptional regulator [Tenuifilaceae bacterium]HPI45648.1 transcriptional regulator [Tenuifilaceae bacterium]HPN20568.1 transcriptional regulator [Tenuifilaceae bacterium]